MTVVAAKIDSGFIEMSCDSLYMRGDHNKVEIDNCKILQGKDMLLGFSGLANIKTLLQIYMQNHSLVNGTENRVLEWVTEFLDFCKIKTNQWNPGQCALLIAHIDGLYRIENWIPIKVTDWSAIGSGFQHAEAALYLGKDTKEAVDVSINLAYGCGGKINTFGLDRNGGEIIRNL